VRWAGPLWERFGAAVAEAIATRRTDTIALVVSENGERVFGDPFFAGVLRGVSATLAGSGRRLVLMMSDDGDHDRFGRCLTAGHVDFTADAGLTTVRQPVEEPGRTTAWRLPAQPAGESHLPPSMPLPTEPVIRDPT
jgi:DNA-binding LacI/PurR family transcriptional regulator